MERFSTKFNLTDPTADAAPDTFDGWASVYNIQIDSWMPTVIRPGAFAASLADMAHRSRVKILWQHDPYEPIGVPTKIDEVPMGLQVTGKVSRTSRGADALVLMKDKVITDLSIGWDPVRWEMVQDPQGTTVRYINEGCLWEFSPVTWGANAPAQITNVHALENLDGMMQHMLRELHEGKVLSAKNQALVTDCIGALQKLLDSANKADSAQTNALDQQRFERFSQAFAEAAPAIEAHMAQTQRGNALRQAELGYAEFEHRNMQLRAA